MSPYIEVMPANLRVILNSLRTKQQLTKPEKLEPSYYTSRNMKSRERDLGVGCPSVDLLAGVSRDHPDGSPSHQVLDGPPGQRTVDPETIGENGRCDELELGGLRQQLIVGGLVKQHHVVDLLLLLSFAPFLLLLLPSAGLGRLRRRRRCLLLLRCLEFQNQR